MEFLFGQRAAFVYTVKMVFEYDSEKSMRNKVKHGIDFEEAQALWTDTDALIISARSDTEPRFMVLGKRFLLWATFVPCMGEAVRIISVRRARKPEVKKYEETLISRRT